ncbi:MAG: hypothetical protein MUP70_08595 [Candidatus Aminicenantes bacterium]|nr:hypothetical protein [Candidatus Aminicenantes bacterium]
MKKIDRLDKLIGIVVAGIILIAVLIIGIRLWHQKKEVPVAGEAAAPVVAAPQPPVILDYARIEKDAELKALMQQRKDVYGINKGLDMIAKPEESIKVGEATVSMQEIIDKIKLEQGKIVEKEIDRPLPTEGTKASAPTEDVYGIYIVQPGDNIWNIHFQFLKDYFEHRGIALSPMADEPDRKGLSSGVGKLLKFSEKIIYIYNLRDRKIDMDLSLIHPLSKVVVFKMKQIFTLLDGIDYNRVNRIQFDGETLWIPANQ